jgi:hypothetical protein
LPDLLVPAAFALTDLGTALALVGIANLKNKQTLEKPVELWWIAFMYACPAACLASDGQR